MKRSLPLSLFFLSLAPACGSGPSEPLKASNDAPSIALNPVTGEPSKSSVAEAQASAEERSRSRERERAEVERAAEERRRREASEPNLSPDGTDPARGKFTLAEATVDLPGSGPLVATLSTSKGDITCTLYDQKAPVTVANFVGLARGTRPWKTPEGRWVKRPAYDGTPFHRVIKGFMIQGGDPQGTGTGEPGYVIPDEIWPGAVHDKAGQLCMANRGPNTNGAQFFITDAPARHLDKSYTIFGDCHPTSTVHAIANVPRNDNDRPEDEILIKKVTITHERGGASPAASAPAASAPAASSTPVARPEAKPEPRREPEPERETRPTPAPAPAPTPAPAMTAPPMSTGEPPRF